MAGKVNHNLINRRLGGAEGSVHVTGAASADEADSLSTGFLALVGMLMVGVAAGAYYMIEPDFKVKRFLLREQQAETSIVDAQCRGDWVPVAINTPTLLCYMTTQPERLCDPKERSQFAMLVREYRTSRDAYETQVLVGGLTGMSGRGGLRLDIGSGNTASATAAGAPSGDHVIFADASADSGPFAAARKLKQVPDGDIISRFRDLAQKGYIAKSDFGWFVDPLIDKALKDLGPVHSECPKAAQ